jgi:hypothetical protein
MTSVISRAPRSRRRTAGAVLAAAVVGIAASLTMSPGSASAAIAPCPKKEFCLYYFNGLQGGRYHFSGSDSNLGNDRFQDGPGNMVTVANSAESVWNNGRADSRGRDDVAVYTGRNFTGSAACVRLGQRGDLRGGFVNNVESYRWITPATCNTIPSALEL